MLRRKVLSVIKMRNDISHSDVDEVIYVIFQEVFLPAMHTVPADAGLLCDRGFAVFRLGQLDRSNQHQQAKQRMVEVVQHL